MASVDRGMMCGGCMPKRYLITLLAFFGEFLLNLLHVNLSIAVVEMTSTKTAIVGNTTEIILETYKLTFGSSVPRNPEFNWTSVEKGLLLGASASGHAFTFLSGAVIARFGGAKVVGIATGLIAVLTTLSPVFVRIHVLAFAAGRALEGFFEGFVTSSFVDVFAHWSPQQERTRLLSFATTGVLVSVAVNYPISGYIAGRLGWPAIFYTSGAVSLIWCCVWLTVVRNDPADDMSLSNEEKAYLRESVGTITSEKVPVPWKSILSSKPVYAIFNDYFTIGWAPTFVVDYLPLYINDVHHVSIENVGLLSSIPVLCGIVTVPVAATIADYLRSNHMSNSKVHKLYLFWSEIVVLISLVVAALNGDFVVCLVCFSILRIAFSFAITTYSVISIDLAGQYAAVLKSMCVSCYSVGNFLNPLVLGLMVPNKTQSEWNHYFLVLCCVTMYGVIVFLVWGSGETQKWAVTSKQEKAAGGVSSE